MLTIGNACFFFLVYQGAEGVTGGEKWYIENVLAELDIGREWFFDDASRTLYYKPNATDAGGAGGADGGGGPPTGEFVATHLEVLINVTGSQAAPARHVAIRGLTLRDTAYTYFEPHGTPSGGDWGLQKTGAITLVGTEGVAISDCLFTRLDGLGVFVGGYARGLVISGNEFAFLGGSPFQSFDFAESSIFYFLD